MSVVSLNPEKFSSFMSIVSLLSSTCNDMVVNKGVICQASNTKAIYFNIDMTSVIGEQDIILSNIQMKEKILSMFKKNPGDVSITMADKEFVFEDSYSMITFRKPLESYITNKYIPSEEMEDKIAVNEKGVLIDLVLEKFIIERLKIMSESLSAIGIVVVFNGKEASFKLRSGDKDSTASGTLMHINNMSYELNGYTVLPVEPFKLSAERYGIQMWFNDKGNIITKISPILGKKTDDTENPTEQMPIDMYSFSMLTQPKSKGKATDE